MLCFWCCWPQLMPEATICPTSGVLFEHLRHLFCQRASVRPREHFGSNGPLRDTCNRHDFSTSEKKVSLNAYTNKKEWCVWPALLPLRYLRSPGEQGCVALQAARWALCQLAGEKALFWPLRTVPRAPLGRIQKQASRLSNRPSMRPLACYRRKPEAHCISSNLLPPMRKRTLTSLSGFNSLVSNHKDEEECYRKLRFCV